MRHLLLICLLCSCAFALRAQLPDLTRRGDTLFAPEAKTYQWLHDGAEVPGATQRFYVPPGKDGVFTVRLRSLPADPTAYIAGPTVVVTGAVLDEFLRPIAGVEVSVAGTTARSDASGRFTVTANRAERLAARAVMSGYHAHTVGFMPTAADTQFVYLHLAKQVTTHKLPANTGGTISQGGFWLTLPPNAVVDADGKAYSGEIQLSVVARRPGDRDFAQRMPGGDFMAVDKNNESKVLYSYGFTGVEMATKDGKPLNMAPDSVATIEFLITEEQRPGAPAEMPLWHFDEDKGLWVEAGTVRKEGLTYKAQVGHFSWWNCDQSFPPAYIEGKVVDCKGNPVTGGVIVVNQRQAYTDTEGRFNGTVPATIDLDFHVVSTDTTLAPLAAEERLLVGTFNTGGWGGFEAFGSVDDPNVLTVYAFGDVEGVAYSLDGKNWQSEPVFMLESDSVPIVGQARAKDCGVMFFHNYSTTTFRDCRVYGASELEALPFIQQTSVVLNAKEAVYRVGVYKEDIHSLVQVALQHRCVQELYYNNTPSMSEALYDGLSRLCDLWPNLQLMNLFDNGLEKLPTAIENLTDLRVLYLYRNELRNLPEPFPNLPDLQELHLGQNKLTSLPESMGNLTRLKSLSLQNNQLKNLPEFLGGLPNLETLMLDGNGLESLPEFLGNLPRLESLSLSFNDISTLPDTFANLADTLKYLNIQGNPAISAQALAHIYAMLPNTQITF